MPDVATTASTVVVQEAVAAGWFTPAVPAVTKTVITTVYAFSPLGVSILACGSVALGLGAVYFLKKFYD